MKITKLLIPVAFVLLMMFVTAKNCLAIDEAISTYNGVAVTDECAIFARNYASTVLGCGWTYISTYHAGEPGAHWVWDDSRLQPANTDRISNDGSNFPQSQDIIVWKSTFYPPSGHIAIVDSASNRNDVVVVDSNWKGDHAGRKHTVSISTTNVSGWFRKKGSSDTTAPTGNIDTPVGDVTVSGTYTFKGWAAELGTGASGIQDVLVLWDGTAFPNINYGVPGPNVGENYSFEFGWDTNLTSNGLHTLQLRIVDKKGNVNDVDDTAHFKRIVTVANPIHVGEFSNHTYDQRIIDAFNRKGGSASVGAPTDYVHANGPIGYSDFAQDFDGGSDGTGSIIANGTAWWVHGRIWSKYQVLGDVHSIVGRPASDEVLSISGASGIKGWYYKFDLGLISHTYEYGAFVIPSGTIYDLYRNQGAETGPLGFPVSDPYSFYNHSRQDFEGGALTDGVVVSLTLNPTSVVSGQASIATVTLSGPGAPVGTTINLSSSDTAVATMPATVMVPEGATTVSFTINTPTRSNMATATITATVADLSAQASLTVNPSAPALTIDDMSIGEGNSGQKSATFYVRLSKPSSKVVKVNFSTGTAGTATANTDYVAVAPTQVSVPVGQTLAKVHVLINGDTLNETDETFRVNLGSAINATIADSQAIGTILNDDAKPALTINNASVAEGNSGTKNLTFTVTLSAPSAQAITVNYATADVTALSTSDYTAKNGTVTFAAGQTSKTVSVVINGDRMVEGDETFYMVLSDAVNAGIGKARGIGTIANDDTSP